MLKQTLYFLMCAAAALNLSACSTSSDDASSQGSAALVQDGSQGLGADVPVGIDADGAVTVGDPNAQYQTQFAGPAALRENNTIYFNYDSDQIQDQYIGVMQAHAQYLRDNPDSRIIIEGHTDERGTPEYNIALGERRARSVARYMQNLGVDVNQLSIVSYGEEKPVDPGHSEAAWSKNRRAVINY